MNEDLKQYLSSIEKDVKREDCFSLVKIMEEESGYEARLHGRIVGFGVHHYVHDSGREGDAIVTGFLPRTQDISIYVMPGFAEYQAELEALGKHKTAKCCLYIRKLADVDEQVLRSVIRHSVGVVQKAYPCRNA